MVLSSNLHLVNQHKKSSTTVGAHLVDKKPEQRIQVDVNRQCQLMDARFGNAPIAGLYGIGQGYSLATSDPLVQAELRPGAKADSVGLYIKQIGNKILSQLLPNSKIRLVMPLDGLKGKSVPPQILTGMMNPLSQ